MHPGFSLDALMTFHEVVELGSLTRASSHLGIAKSTISRQIAGLEQQMGTVLLKRSARHVEPTEVGRQLLEKCKQIVRATAEVGELVDTSRNVVSGTLRVVLPNEFGASWMGKAIADFAALYPELRLQVNVAAQTPNLVNEPFDVAIAFGKLQDSQLISRRLATLSQGMFTSPAYIRRHGEPKDFADLLNHEFITQQVTMRQGLTMSQDRGLKRKIAVASRLEVNSVRLARDMVVSGMGVSVLPRALCRRYVESGALVPIFRDWHAPLVQVSAIVLARNGMPKRLRKFLDFIAEQIHVQETGA